MLWVLIRSAHWGTSNEYPQHIFLWRNWGNDHRIITKYSCLTSPLLKIIPNLFGLNYCSMSKITIKYIVYRNKSFHYHVRSLLALVRKCLQGMKNPWSAQNMKGIKIQLPYSFKYFELQYQKKVPSNMRTQPRFWSVFTLICIMY